MADTVQPGPTAPYERRRINQVHSYLNISSFLGVLNIGTYVIFVPSVSFLPADLWATWLFYRIVVTSLFGIIGIVVVTWAASSGVTKAFVAFVWLILHGLWGIVLLVFTAIDISNCMSTPYCWVDPPGEQALVVWIIAVHSIVLIILGAGAAIMIPFAEKPKGLKRNQASAMGGGGMIMARIPQQPVGSKAAFPFGVSAKTRAPYRMVPVQ